MDIFKEISRAGVGAKLAGVVNEIFKDVQREDKLEQDLLKMYYGR